MHVDAVPLVSRYVEEFLADLKRRLPDTELRIMTGMAQGADLLVARAAVKAGWKVDAVLPMALERYIEDFDATSGAAFRELLADPAVSCTVLPPPPGADPNAAHGAGLVTRAVGARELRGQARAEARPEDGDDDVGFRRLDELHLEGGGRDQRLVFPENGLERDAAHVLALQALDDAAGQSAFLAHVAMR